MNSDGALHPTLQLFLVAWFNEALNDWAKAYPSFASMYLMKQNQKD